MEGDQQYPQAGYGSYYGQQAGAAQYAYPKKKFPWLYIILGIVILAIIIAGGSYLLFFRGPGTPDLLVSPSTVSIQVSPGDIATAKMSISNPKKKTIQTSLQGNLPAWINLDKNIITLGPGETTDITITASPTVTSQTTSTVIFFSGTEISSQIFADVLPSPDISLSLSKTSISLYEGDETSILAQVKNNGLSNAFNISFDVVGIPSGWVNVENIENFNLGAGKDVTIPIAIKIPEKTTTGTYQGLISIKGTGFDVEVPVSFTVSQGLGVLGVSPPSITGSYAKDSNLRIVIGNTGNSYLQDITIKVSSGLSSDLKVTPGTIELIEAGQNSETILTVIGNVGAKNGNIEISAIDTHGNTQTKFITVSMSVIE